MGALLALVTGPAARYLIGAAILAVLVGGSYRWGVNSEHNRNAAAMLEVERKHVAAAAAHRAAVAALNAQSQDLANTVESEAVAYANEIARLAADNRRLAASNNGRLRDPNATAAACPRVPQAGDTAHAIDPAADGAFISESLSGLLLAESERADRVAAYAATCYNWVSKLNGR